MPISVPVPSKSPGDVFTSTMWNSYLRDNINKLLDRGHRQLSVAQFMALTAPEFGDEVYVQVDGTSIVYWHFVYGDAGTRWIFIGGPPLYSEVATSEATSSLTYTALATAGPAIALPRSGDYDVEVGYGHSVIAAANNMTMMSYDIGGTGAVDADSAESFTSNGTPWNTTSAARKRRKTGLTPVALTAKYRNVQGATSVPYAKRWMAVTPVGKFRHDA